MSRSFKHGYCPKCGTLYTGSSVVGVRIDADNGYWKKRIISTDYFYKKCKKCGHEFYMNYEFSYEDPHHAFKIWAIPRDSYVSYDLAWIQSTESMPGYKKRIVSSTPLLCEKVAFLDTGRDDRVLELCKRLLIKQINRQNSNLNITKAFYSYEDSEDIIYLYGDHELIIRCLIAPYMTEIVEKKYKRWLDLDNDNVFVNSQWAETFFSKVGNVDDCVIISFLTPESESEKAIVLNAANHPKEDLIKDNAFKAFLKKFKKE